MKIYSIEAFRANESHLQEYIGNKVKFEYFNDYSEMPNSNGTLNLDLVSSVLPCAGLSTLNRTNRGQNAEQNMHMLKAAQYVLSDLQPIVYFGENAPGLFTAENFLKQQRPPA